MLVYCNECKDKKEAYELMKQQLNDLGYDIEEYKSSDSFYKQNGEYMFNVVVCDRRTGCVENNERDIWEFYAKYLEGGKIK